MTLFLLCVFTVHTDDVKVFVLEGESVTLNTAFTDGNIDDVKWKFNDADLTHSRFRNIEVNQQTGDLRITNIRPKQSGEYEVKINGGGLILHKRYRINVRGE